MADISLRLRPGAQGRSQMNELVQHVEDRKMEGVMGFFVGDAPRKSHESLRLPIRDVQFGPVRRPLLTSKQPQEIRACSILSAIQLTEWILPTWRMRKSPRGHQR